VYWGKSWKFSSESEFSNVFSKVFKTFIAKLLINLLSLIFFFALQNVKLYLGIFIFFTPKIRRMPVPASFMTHSVSSLVFPYLLCLIFCKPQLVLERGFHSYSWNVASNSLHFLIFSGLVRNSPILTLHFRFLCCPHYCRDLKNIISYLYDYPAINLYSTREKLKFLLRLIT
jgi:hypothetical protein